MAYVVDSELWVGFAVNGIPQSMREGPPVAFVGYFTGAVTPTTLQILRHGVPGTDYAEDTWPDDERPEFRADYVSPPEVPTSFDFRLNEVFLAF